MHITIQTCYGLQYLIMRLSGYMNAPTEPAFLALKNGIEFLMRHPHEPIIYSRKKLMEQTKFPIIVTSKQDIQKSAKIRNTPTSFTHMVMQIMMEISLIDIHSHLNLISSMIPINRRLCYNC